MTWLLSITAALAVLFFSGWTLFWRDRSTARYTLALALLVTATVELLDLVPFIQLDVFDFWKRSSLLVQASLPAVWILASATQANDGGLRGMTIPQRVLFPVSLFFLIPVFTYPVSSFFFTSDFPADPVLFVGPAGIPFYLGIMAFLVISLINLEPTLTNTSPGEGLKLKFTNLGISTVLAAYILYFSQALLFRVINLDFIPIRSVLLLVAVGMMAYGRIYQDEGQRLRISWQVAFKSIVLIAVGIYLVLIGLVGKWMIFYGADFQHSATIGIILLSGVALVLVLLSARTRRQIKVFLHKNFYRSKYDYRVQWLQFTERLANCQSGADLQRVILSAYCDTFGTQGAALFQLDADLRSFVNTSVHEMPPLSETFKRDNSLVRHIDGRGWVFRHTDGFLDLSKGTKDFLVRYQVSFVVPLQSGDHMEGFIVLGKLINPNEAFIYEDYDLMKTIARQASFALRSQRLSEQLARVREMEAIGNIAAFVIHDLKNHVAGLSLMVDNARQYIDNPEFQQDMLRSLDNTVNKMQGLIARLKNLGEKELLNLQPVDLLTVVRRAMAFLPADRVTVTGGSLVVKVDAEELQKVFMNLLFNAVEASPDGSLVSVELAMAGAPFVRVVDQGIGMSSDFIRRELFKPFATTKKKGLGIGLYQSRQIVEAHGGRLEVQSEVGKGTVFTVWLKQSGDWGPVTGNG